MESERKVYNGSHGPPGTVDKLLGSEQPEHDMYEQRREQQLCLSLAPGNRFRFRRGCSERSFQAWSQLYSRLTGFCIGSIVGSILLLILM